jgi:hypothetical protein
VTYGIIISFLIHMFIVLCSMFLPLSSMTDACKPAALLPYSIPCISAYTLGTLL